MNKKYYIIWFAFCSMFFLMPGVSSGQQLPSDHPAAFRLAHPPKKSNTISMEAPSSASSQLPVEQKKMPLQINRVAEKEHIVQRGATVPSTPANEKMLPSNSKEKFLNKHRKPYSNNAHKQ